MSYRASNGVTVSSETQGITGYRRIKLETELSGETVEISGQGLVALVESLDHERDEELKRWRWPERPEFVMYPDGDGVVVFDEKRGIASSLITRGAAARSAIKFPHHAAHAYFEAHPLPAIPSDASYITWCDVRDNGEERIAMRYGHHANKVWRIGWDTLDEADLVRDYIGDGLVTVLVRKDES